MVHALTVGQLAHLTDTAVKTIRYYEEIGVLPLPSRSAAGYRQYARGDIHRLLFVRRARALGLSLPSIKTLISNLSNGQRPEVRPQLQHLLIEQLCTVRKQIAEFQLLEQQLEQILHRLPTVPSPSPAESCRCLEIEILPGQGTSQQRSPTMSSKEETSAADTLESLTRLSSVTEESCHCGCGCYPNNMPPTPPALPQSTQINRKDTKGI
jgi:DNA-binding transcriptional MerR regulator